MDVGVWLRSLGLGEYEEKFRDNKIAADVLADLTDGDLEKLELPVGDRKRLLKSIAGLAGQSSAATRLESAQARPPRPAAPLTSHCVPDVCGHDGAGYVPQATLLDVSGVTLQYKTGRQLVTATYRVDFSIKSSDRFVLLGPSGCGKSTLLKAVGGYLEPVEGEIRLRGKRITRPGPDRMMVFQEFDQLLPWMSVLGNVMFPLVETGKLSGSAAREKAMEYIRKVNLVRVVDNYPHTLSGGMKQRVAIARGMAMEPDILLMDEPFASLDALTRRQMQEELLQLWADTRFTVMFVTHSMTEAIKIGNRILLLSPHPGEVVAELNCPPPDSDEPGWQTRLERRINDMLFADVDTGADAHG